ncbi:unnamed protein product [Amoebophrya sp. A120]|nr:unnamed protein product [Amoebophrya sp. A120]|eukprot:GSA120T00002838001.1
MADLPEGTDANMAAVEEEETSSESETSTSLHATEPTPEATEAAYAESVYVDDGRDGIGSAASAKAVRLARDNFTAMMQSGVDSGEYVAAIKAIELDACFEDLRKLLLDYEEEAHRLASEEYNRARASADPRLLPLTTVGIERLGSELNAEQVAPWLWKLRELLTKIVSKSMPLQRIYWDPETGVLCDWQRRARFFADYREDARGRERWPVDFPYHRLGNLYYLLASGAMGPVLDFLARPAPGDSAAAGCSDATSGERRFLIVKRVAAVFTYHSLRVDDAAYFSEEYASGSPQLDIDVASILTLPFPAIGVALARGDYNAVELLEKLGASVAPKRLVRDVDPMNEDDFVYGSGRDVRNASVYGVLVRLLNRQTRRDWLAAHGPGRGSTLLKAMEYISSKDDEMRRKQRESAKRPDAQTQERSLDRAVIQLDESGLMELPLRGHDEIWHNMATDTYSLDGFLAYMDTFKLDINKPDPSHFGRGHIIGHFVGRPLNFLQLMRRGARCPAELNGTESLRDIAADSQNIHHSTVMTGRLTQCWAQAQRFIDSHRKDHAKDCSVAPVEVQEVLQDRIAKLTNADFDQLKDAEPKARVLPDLAAMQRCLRSQLQRLVGRREMLGDEQKKDPFRSGEFGLQLVYNFLRLRLSSDDPVKPILCALLQSGNEYGLGAQSCDPQRMILAILLGRTDGLESSDAEDGEGARARGSGAREYEEALASRYLQTLQKLRASNSHQIMLDAQHRLGLLERPKDLQEIFDAIVYECADVEYHRNNLSGMFVTQLLDDLQRHFRDSNKYTVVDFVRLHHLPWPLFRALRDIQGIADIFTELFLGEEMAAAFAPFVLCGGEGKTSEPEQAASSSAKRVKREQ